jgi:hypothetical protein
VLKSIEPGCVERIWDEEIACKVAVLEI